MTHFSPEKTYAMFFPKPWFLITRAQGVRTQNTIIDKLQGFNSVLNEGEIKYKNSRLYLAVISFTGNLYNDVRNWHGFVQLFQIKFSGALALECHAYKLNKQTREASTS